MPPGALSRESLHALLQLPELEQVRQALRGTEFEGEVYLVGGAVRDALLGRRQSHDLDLVTERNAEELADLLFRRGVAQSPAEVYARFGTAMLRVGTRTLELIQARSESYRSDSRKPEVQPSDLQSDAMRRDFTVNALLAHLESGEVLDLTGHGLSDLEAGILRTPLEASQTFFDDPLRMLRAVRFRRQLDFEPAPDLYPAIRLQAPRLRVISAERIQEEFSKIILLPAVAGGLQDLLETELLAQFAPDLVAMVGVEQGSFHHLDVWEHTLKVVEGTPPDLILRLAALLHDVGKPTTRFVDTEGRTRFFGHEEVGAKLATDWLTSLRYGHETIEEVALLVRNHMRLGTAPQWTPAATRRLIRDLGASLERLLTLVEADGKAMKKGTPTVDLNPVRTQIETVLQNSADGRFESPLDGKEIQEILGLSPGPMVGKAKAWLVELVLEGELAPTDAETARKLLLERYQQETPATENVENQ